MPEICYDKVPAAIYADKQNNQRFLDDRERKDWSDTDVLEKVKYKGMINPTENLNIVKHSRSMACPVEFSQQDYSLEECRLDNHEPGTQTGKDNCNADMCSEFDTLVTQKDGSCKPEFCEIPYAQGHRVIEPFDWSAELKSQTMCAEELYNLGGSKHLYDYNESVKEHFSNWLTYNYQLNLLNELAVRAECNSSEGYYRNGSVASKYSWYGKPQGYLTITHLKGIWKEQHIKGGLKDGKLHISGPAEDFIRAIQEYECNVLGRQMCDVRYPRTQYENVEGMLRKREMIEYENICYYINEYPRKAIWLGEGSTARLKYIYPYIDSSELAEVGIMRDDNPDYYGETVWCDGSEHDLITIYDCIHPDAAERWTLEKPINPESNNTSTGLELHVATDWQVGKCNINRDMWFYYSRPRMRHLVEFPEHIGFHLALSRDTGGGQVYISQKKKIISDTTACGTDTLPPRFNSCDNDFGCTECGETTTCDPVVATITPCPNKEIFYEGNFANGDTQEAAFRIRLSETACAAGEIEYAFADDTAVLGTNYDATNGTVTVEEGDVEIVVPFTVLGVDPDADGDGDSTTTSIVSGTFQLVSASGGVVLGTECTESTFCIIDNSVVCDTSCGAAAACTNCVGNGEPVSGITTL